LIFVFCDDRYAHRLYGYPRLCLVITPAMEAGVSNRLWSIGELVDAATLADSR
jgi:hypothetical protein